MHKKDLKVRVGISIGDLNGIGPEIILKTFSDSRMMEFCTPVVFGSTKVLSYHRKAMDINVDFLGTRNLNQLAPRKLNVYNIWKDVIQMNLGKPSEEIGRYAIESFKEAVKALKEGKIDVLVTAPINKQTVQSEDFDFPGHTDYLAQELKGKPLMMMVSEEMKLGLVTDHIPIKYVASQITREKLRTKLETIHQTLQRDFLIEKPKIAVLGLNPHCGDGGLIGKEDDEIIVPLIEEMKNEGYFVFGPYAADGFFGAGHYKNFDAVLAMYHDQGLIPFKTLSFHEGVNFTAGLEKVRTSPDHGTAYEIAGKGLADPTSFRNAVYLAVDIFNRRKEYEEMKANQTQKQEVAPGTLDIKTEDENAE